ncbi:MAG TPA: FAD binding domain-containing protein [Tepidisphaeraceae bacterium]|jgi:xanthine dehydrogenase small subunit
MRESVLFFLNGRREEVCGDDVFLPVSEYVRRGKQLPGTKVVCAEGDCGACTVLLGRVRDGAIAYAPVCACILFVFQLDAGHLITIEGLKDAGALSPVQQAMVTCHGTQCGFCTPGFVVTMHDLLARDPSADTETVRRGLVGNLCRCTGYDAILQSAAACDRAALRSPGELYPPGPIVVALAPVSGDEVRVYTETRKFYKPATVEQAVTFRAANPACTLVAGATDVGVLMSKRVRAFGVLMSVAHLPEMRGVGVLPALANDSKAGGTPTPHVLRIGASATWAEVETATRDALPELSEYLAYFGSPLIKNAGTAGGNVVTGSPIGDSLPPLCVLDAEIELASPIGRRRVNVNAFYTGYRQNVMAADEIVVALHVPLPAAGDVLRLYKISRRKDMDISTFSAAFGLHVVADRIADVRIAFGGVAATVLRMTACEDFLRDKPITRDVFAKAGRLAAASITPLSDVRGSADYRRLLAENIFGKFFHDLGGGSGGVNHTQRDSGPLSRVLAGEG